MTAGELRQSLQSLQKNKADTGGVDLLLRLSQHYIFKPGELAPDMDSAGLLLQQAITWSRQIAYKRGLAGCCLQLAVLSREKGDRAKGRKLTDSAILLCNRYKEFNLLGESYLELKQYYDWQQDNATDTMRACDEKALEAFRQTGNIKRQAECLQSLADLNQIDKNYPVTINQARRALDLYKSIGYKELQGLYDLLNVSYCEISDYPSAIQYGLLAAKTAESVGDTSMQLCTIYTRLGSAFYVSRTNLQEALNYHYKALAIAKKYNDLNAVYIVSPQIVVCYVAGQRFPEVLWFARQLVHDYPPPENNHYFRLAANRMLLMGYTVTKNYTEAQKYCDRMLDIYRQPGANKFYGRLDLVRFYMASRQYSKAEASLLVHNELLKGKSENANTYIFNRQFWFMLDSARGNYLSAISYFRQYKKAQDSVFNENRSKIVETLKIEYDLEKKEQDLQLKTKSIDLLTTRSEVQQQQIQRSALLQNITVAGILILAGFLGLLYNRYHIKMKAGREISSKNKELQHLVEEKEWLVKEVHHRVKNNLQTIVSLLESQSAYLNNTEAMLAIQDSQNRVYAMSLIHQKLYQADNVAAINMGTYLAELVNYLRDSFTIRQQIQFHLQVIPIELDVSQAVPIGLILNEAITNCIKYAFPRQGRSDAITICMEREDNRIRLTVSDNGAGLPPGFDVTKSSGLGLKLMKGLTEDIGGQFAVQSDPGTTISIDFRANTPIGSVIPEGII
jgi:two-component sensor histidine kinase